MTCSLQAMSFKEGALAKFHSAIRAKGAPAGQAYEQDAEVMVLKGHLSNFDNQGKVLASLIHHFCDQGVLEIVTRCLEFLTYYSDFSRKHVPNALELPSQILLGLLSLGRVDNTTQRIPRKSGK